MSSAEGSWISSTSPDWTRAKLESLQALHRVVELEVGEVGARGADADNAVHVVELVELVAVDADGGHAHAAGHHGDGLAVVGTRIGADVADVAHEFGVVQEGLGDETGALRVARHEDGLGDLVFLGRVVGSGGRHGLILSKKATVAWAVAYPGLRAGLMPLRN